MNLRADHGFASNLMTIMMLALVIINVPEAFTYSPKGILIKSRVPAPGADSTVSSPPILFIRSRILLRP